MHLVDSVVLCFTSCALLIEALGAHKLCALCTELWCCFGSERRFVVWYTLL